MSGYICAPYETFGLTIFRGQECSTFWKWNSIKISWEGIGDQSSLFKAFILTISRILMTPFAVFGLKYHHRLPQPSSYQSFYPKCRRTYWQVVLLGDAVGGCSHKQLLLSPLQFPRWLGLCPQKAQCGGQHRNHTTQKKKGWRCGTLVSTQSVESEQMLVLQNECCPAVGRNLTDMGGKTPVEKVSRGPHLLVCKKRMKPSGINRDKFPWNEWEGDKLDILQNWLHFQF